jgi:O-antigen/teichoic acid export membrane protein
VQNSHPSPGLDSHPPITPAVPTSFGPGTVSRDAFVSLLYSGAVRLGTLGLSIAAARRLGSAGAGALGVALQVVALASLAATYNLPQGLTQHLSRATDPAARTRLLLVSGGLIAVLALVTASALMFAAPQLARDAYGDPSLAPVLFACGPLTLAAAAYLWVEGALQGLRRFGTLARWGIVVAIADVVVGVITSSWSVVVMLVSRAVLRLIAAAVAALRWFGPATPIERGDVRSMPDDPPPPAVRAVATSLLAFATPTLAAGAVLLSGNTLLRVLLVRSHELAAAGYFQAADSLAQGVTLVPLAAAAAFMPAVAAHAGRPDRELAQPFRRAIEQVTGYNVALCLAALGLAPWVMVNVFGREFGPARPVFVLLVCAYASVGPSALFGAWLMGRGRPWVILSINVLWAAVMLLVFRFGLARWGAPGAACASAVAYWLALACYAFGVAPARALPWSSHLPAIVATALALACGAALQLLPGVPVALAVGGNLLLAGIVFARWGAASLTGSGLLRWRTP